MVPINYVAVLGGAVASVLLGMLWYGPLFGKTWMRLLGVTKEQMEKAKSKSMAGSYALQIITSLVMSYVLANAIVFAGSYFVMDGILVGLMCGFFNWIGFIAPVTISRVIWEKQPCKLWLIDSMYYLVDLLIIGSLISIWR